MKPLSTLPNSYKQKKTNPLPSLRVSRSVSSIHLIVKAAGGEVKKFYSVYRTTSGTSARYYLALFGDLRRFGDVIEGRVPVQGAPAALVGDWGEGKGGGGSVHDEQRKGEGEGEGGGCEGSSRREQYEGRALRSSINTLPSSVSSDANNPKPSVLGRGPSQCRILRYSARVSLFGRGGRLWGVYKPMGGERALTVSIPCPFSLLLLVVVVVVGGGVTLLLVMLPLRCGLCCAHTRRREGLCWRGRSCSSGESCPSHAHVDRTRR